MSFVCANLAVFVTGFVISLLGWLYGGTRSDVLASTAPWLIFFLAETLFFFPQKRHDETTYQARERVWKSLKHDSLIWVSVVLLGLLAIPFLNKGLCPYCDYKLIKEGINPAPPFGFLPFCVSLEDHYNVFLWFAVALSTLITIRHALTSSGKRMLLKLIVWNGFALAIVGFVQIATGAVGPLWREMINPKTGKVIASVSTFFSTFGYPNMAGDYFTTMFGLALALWRCSLSETDVEAKSNRSPSEKAKRKYFWRRHVALMPAGVFYFAAISTLSRAAIMLVNVILVIGFVHSLVDVTHHMPRKKRVRNSMIALIVVFLAAFFAIVTMPDDVRHEVNTLDTKSVLDRVSGKGQYHTRVANAIWAEHRLFGCGGWGYKHFCGQKMRELDIDLKEMQIRGGINVHNDHLQFLTEHGLVGFGLILAIVLMLVIPIIREWIKLVKAAQFTEKKKAPPKPVQIFALPAPIFFILMTSTATIIHGFGDCPLRSAAVLTLFFASLGIMPGFLPKEYDNVAR